MRTRPDPPDQMLLFGEIRRDISTGVITITPRKPAPTCTPKQAVSILGVPNLQSIYRLIQLGYLAASKPTPHRWTIDTESVIAHREAVRDPEFWARPAPFSIPPAKK